MNPKESSPALGLTESFAKSLKLDQQVKNSLRIKAVFVKIIYMVKLSIIRELSILVILTKNYAKIPRPSLSRLVIWPFTKSARLKKGLYKLATKSQSLIMLNS